MEEGRSNDLGRQNSHQEGPQDVAGKATANIQFKWSKFPNIWINLEQQVTTLLLKVLPRRWTPAWRYLRCGPTTRERTSATWRRTGNPSTRSTPLMFLYRPLFRWDPFFSLSAPRIGIFLVLFYGFVFNLVCLQAQPSNGKFVVRSGSTITLECRAQGNPMPRVSWTRLVRLWGW